MNPLPPVYGTGLMNTGFMSPLNSASESRLLMDPAQVPRAPQDGRPCNEEGGQIIGNREFGTPATSARGRVGADDSWLIDAVPIVNGCFFLSNRQSIIIIGRHAQIINRKYFEQTHLTLKLRPHRSAPVARLASPGPGTLGDSEDLYCFEDAAKGPQLEETNTHIFVNHTFLEESQNQKSFVER